MSITNRIRSTNLRSQRLALPAIACLLLGGSQLAEAADTANRSASESRSSGMSAKSFGPGTKKSRPRATAENLPALPAGLPHVSVRPAPGDALLNRRTTSRVEAGPKEMPQPLVAGRSAPRHQSDPSRATASGEKPSGTPSSSLPKLRREADPRTNPSDKLPQEQEIPKLTQRHDAKGPTWSATTGTPTDIGGLDEARRMLHEIIVADRRADATGASDGEVERTARARGEMLAIIRKLQEMERSADVDLGPIRDIKLSDSPKGIVGAGSAGIAPEGGSQQKGNAFPLTPVGQGSNDGESDRGQGGNDPGYQAGPRPDREPRGDGGGGGGGGGGDGGGSGGGGGGGIRVSGQDPSSSRQEQSTAKETTKKDNSSDKKTDPPKKDPMESQKKKPAQEGLPADDGNRGGNDVGGHRPGRGARDNRGGLQQLREPQVRAVGTKTGAGDEETLDVGARGGAANSSGDQLSNRGNDLRGRRGNSSGGAQVPGPTDGFWWFVHGSRARPTNR